MKCVYSMYVHVYLLQYNKNIAFFLLYKFLFFVQITTTLQYTQIIIMRFKVYTYMCKPDEYKKKSFKRIYLTPTYIMYHDVFIYCAHQEVYDTWKFKGQHENLKRQ